MTPGPSDGQEEGASRDSATTPESKASERAPGGSKWEAAGKTAREHPLLSLLTLLGTVVGIVSGTLAIVETFSDNDATASQPTIEQVEFRRDIGAVCATWRDRTQPEIGRDFRRLKRQLRSAKSSADQSVALINYHQRTAARYRALRLQFSALTPPSRVRADHERVDRAWTRAIQSYVDYRDALKQAGTRRQILAAAQEADRRRSVVERDSEIVSEGLDYLSAGECDLPSQTPRAILALPVPASETGDPAKPTRSTESVTLRLVDVAQPEVNAAAAPEDDRRSGWLLPAVSVLIALAGVCGLILARREQRESS